MRSTSVASRRASSTIAGSFSYFFAKAHGLFAGLDVLEPHDAALGLRDDLLADDDDVAVAKARRPATIASPTSAARSSPGWIGGNAGEGMDRDGLHADVLRGATEHEKAACQPLGPLRVEQEDVVFDDVPCAQRLATRRAPAASAGERPRASTRGRGRARDRRDAAAVARSRAASTRAAP